jgi:endoglucanase
MLGLQPARGQENPAKLATTGRLDFTADAAIGAIDDGRVMHGGGSVERMSWVPEAAWPRGYTFNFPISHMAWREFAVQVTPKQSGVVTLTLMGPWEESSPGVIYQQEVLWDSIEVAGTTLENGDFESVSGTSTTGWRSNGGVVVSATQVVPAPDGKRFARTWHNGTLTTTLDVTGGTPVSIRLRARAAVPAEFKEMRRFADRNTPAHQAAKRFMRGTNLGNYLEAPPGQNWGASYSTEDFDYIKAEGFDHVRLPIAWHHHTGPGPEFRIKDEFYARVDFLVNEATKRGLAAIVNIHHFDAFTSNPPGQREKFLAIWRQLAAHYAAVASSVAFELLNEPKDAATTDVLNAIYVDAIREIRKTNPTRTIFVGPGKWNQVSELPHLRLPDDDMNLIVTVHCYDPFQFTHQGASWAGPEVRALKGIQFPGPPKTALVPDSSAKLSSSLLDWIERYNSQPAESNPSSPRAFRGIVHEAKEWSDYYGRPVHMGEFGAYVAADSDSRARFYKSFREELDAAGIGWAMWDWKAGFRYWDEKAGTPAPGLREALFPK